MKDPDYIECSWSMVNEKQYYVQCDGLKSKVRNNHTKRNDTLSKLNNQHGGHGDRKCYELQIVRCDNSPKLSENNRARNADQNRSTNPNI